ncbi:MAG: 4Fe-4S dicluster domain-containing protein, partial [Alphaproteobacteria bacterium]
LAVLLRVLARSATGQDFSTYTTVYTGARRPDDPDGPEAFHVVLLDNGRSALLGGELREVLRCIRCGACMNHCPVYQRVGGHAYGWVYPGPIGAIMTPALTAIATSHPLPNASTLCGRCEEVCPVRIPLPKLLRYWRTEAAAAGLPPLAERLGLTLWAWLARRPALYRLAVRQIARRLKARAGDRGALRRLPLMGGWAGHWLQGRDLPAPQGRSFMDQWRAQKKGTRL